MDALQSDLHALAGTFHAKLISSFLSAEAAICALTKSPSAALTSEWDQVAENFPDLMGSSGSLDLFRAQRKQIASAANESPIVICPSGNHHPSYHDAAWGIVNAVLDDLFVVVFDDQPNAYERVILGYRPPDAFGAVTLQSKCVGWSEIFANILSEYQANLATEAAGLVPGISSNELSSLSGESNSRCDEEEKTCPLSKSRAAELMGYKGNKKADWINCCVDDGTIKIWKKTRQTFLFRVSDFPPEVRDIVRPQVVN